MGGHAGTSPSPSSGPAESPLGKDPAPEAPAARWEAPDVGTRVPRLLQSPGWCEAVPGTGTLTLPHWAVPPSEGQRAETSSSRGTPSLSAGCLIRASPQAAALRESRDNSIPSIGTHCSSCPRLGSQGSGLACPAPQELPALLVQRGKFTQALVVQAQRPTAMENSRCQLTWKKVLAATLSAAEGC